MIISGGQPHDFAPQALAEVTPLSSATGYFYAPDGTFVGDHFAAYGALYRAQPWLATVVDKVSNSAARLSFVSWKSTPTGKVLDDSSGYAKLWVKPCLELPPYAFWRWTFSTYELYGEAFWLKLRDDAGRVISLYPMHPTRTQVRRRKDGHIEYVFSIGVASAGLLTVDATEVVPFLRYNPDNIMRGMSRVEPLRNTLANEDAARRSTQSAWTRGARPSLMLSTEGKLSPAAMERLKTQVDSNHAGPDNAGGSLILEEGLKPFPVQLTADEMQYIDSRKLNREEVCAVYDVPPPVVHILDHATFSNITEQMRSMYRDTMAPRLEDVESAIDHYLRPDFDISGAISARFALDEVLRGDFETRATAVGTLIERGVMKPSEARPLFDLPDAGSVADKLYANAALQELGKPAERISLTESGLPPTPAQQQMMDDAQAAAATEDNAAAAQNGGKTAPSRRGGRPPKKE